MNTVGSKIFAVQQFSFAAEMAVSAEFRVIRSNFIANREAFYRITDLDNDSACFVTCDDGHFGIEVAIVDVEVCSADTTGLDYPYVRYIWFMKFSDIIPLTKISCALGFGTGIVTKDQSLTLLYLIAFISVGIV